MPHPHSRRAKTAKAKRAQQSRRVSGEDKHVVEERRAVRQRRREEAVGKRDRRRRRRRIRNVIFAAATLAVAGYGLWLALGPAAELAGVERPRDRGRGHVAAATFPSATPTSGPHSAQSPACRVYSEPLPLDLAVHGLEHGAVVLWYDADQPSLAAELVSVTSRWDSHVIISPAAELESPVVATAWRRKKAYLDVNEDLVDFIDIYRRRGPERVPCA